MTRTFDRRVSAILFCAAMAAALALLGGCADRATVSTNGAATPSVVISTTAPTSLAAATTTTTTTTAVTATSMTIPAALPRRTIESSRAVATSPYEEGDEADSVASADEPARPDTSSVDSPDSPGSDPGDDAVAPADDDADPEDGADPGDDADPGAQDELSANGDAADREVTTTSSTRTPTPSSTATTATTATTQRRTTSTRAYVVTAVPQPSTTAYAGPGRPSTTVRRTTPPTFLASPDRSSPTVRRTTTSRRPAATTTTRPVTTTTLPPTTTTTTTAPPTTTTTIYRGALGGLDPNAPATGRAAHLPPRLPSSLAPLTGLPVTATNARGAVVVKVDNAGPARPQTGLDIADIVYEERVEGAATRFAAVFHSKGSGSVGPIRSARSTDIGILGSFSRPAFVFSGANEEFRRLVAGQQIVDLGADVWGGYWRSSQRRAPYNLYAKLSTVWNKAPGVAPKPHFAYRAAGTPSPASAASVSAITVSFDSNKVGYSWHAASGTWRRSQNGRSHSAASGARIAPKNVIVQNVRYDATGLTDVTGAPVPEARLVGSGTALVFTDGKVIPATWSKPSLASITTFIDSSGKAILLTPGQTWVELADPGATVWS